MSAAQLLKGYPLEELSWIIPEPRASTSSDVAVQVDYGARARGTWKGETGEIYPEVCYEAWVDRSSGAIADALAHECPVSNLEGMLRVAHSADGGRTWDRIEVARPVGERDLLHLVTHMNEAAISIQHDRHGQGPLPSADRHVRQHASY